MVTPIGQLRLTPITADRELGRVVRRTPRPKCVEKPVAKARPMPTEEAPRLRLTGAGTIEQPRVKPVDVRPDAKPAPPSLQATDPRWVLAIRVGESLEGTLLPAEKRERLSRLGQILGLTPFDTSLIIAIVQDQARRGHDPSRCAAAGAAQLAMVTPVQSRRTLLGMGRPAIRRAIFMALVLLTLQAAWLLWWLSQAQ